MKHIWWNQVTNAVQYVSQITEALLDEKSILIKHASSIPWKAEFESSVVESVKLQNSEKKFEKISSVAKPGEYMLNEYCKKEKRATYRPSIGYSRFLAENDDIVLHDRYFWVEVENVAELDAWMKFSSEYIKERGKKNKAAFIFDLFSNETVSPKKGIKLFILDDYIGEYDRIVFSVLAASEIKENGFIKSYLAELVSNIAGNDVELCAECINHYSEFLKSPIECIHRICATNVRMDGSAYCYSLNPADVEHLLWLSQIRTFYPYIEEYREDFVRKNFVAISKQLPITASYGEVYSVPEDVELGTLKYMADCKYIILSSNDYEMLKRFKEARNKLSHLAYLSIDEINELVQK